MSAKVQEEDKKRKRQGHDELELEETTEVCVTRPRAPKRPRKNADIVQRQVNTTAKSPQGTTSKARFLWTAKTKEAFFEALCKHGKDFDKICVYMNGKLHLKQIIPNLTKNQVRFFYYRTWKLVSGYYGSIKQGNGESSKSCDIAASMEVSAAVPVGRAVPSTSAKDYLTDEEFSCDETQPPANLATMAAESIVGGAKDELESNAAEEEMFSDEGRVTPVTADIEKDEISDNSEHESEDDTEEEPSPLEGTVEEPEDQGNTEEQEDPLPTVGGAGSSAAQEQSSGGSNVSTVTGKEVMVDGRMLPLDLVSLICYGKYRSKLQALGNKSEIGRKLYQLVHDGVTTIKYKGRKMQLKMPLCVALKSDNRSSEQGHDGIVAGGIPNRTDHMILKLIAYNSESWSHVQQLSFNPRLRIVLPSNKTLSSVIKLLLKRWNLPELEGRNSVKIFYWLQTCDDKGKGCSGHQIPCEQEDHTALELTYDGDTTLADIAMKLQAKSSLELMYDISELVQKGSAPSGGRMGSLLRVVKVASRNERITPRVLSRISPRKYSLFGSPFQRLTHRIAFGSRSRVKLDFSSPKKNETVASAAPTTTTPSPPTNSTATPINVEEVETLNQSPGMKVIVQQTSSNGETGNIQSSSTTFGSQKSGVKSVSKKSKGNKRTRIVTFDEHQLNQSGSFSSIPIKDLLMLAQQQVNSFKSPKKSSTPSCPSSPQPISPPQSFTQPRQKISSVTAVTIPNEIASNIVTTPSIITTTTAGVSSLQQQDVGGAACSGSNNPCAGLSVTMANTTANAMPNVTTALATSCVSTIAPTPVTTSTHTTSIQQDVEIIPPPPVQTRPAKIIQQRPPRPITNQRSLVPQPLSFFNTSVKRAGSSGTMAGSQQSTQSGASVAKDAGRVSKATESSRKQQQGALGKTASSLNVQNLTLVQQIQLLALIQQYQTMQKPKTTTAASQSSTAAQAPLDKTVTTDHQNSTNEPFNKSSPVPVHDRETDELETDLYKLMHAAPIKTTPKKLGQPLQSLPPDEVSSDTVNNLLTSLMYNQSSNKHQQDLARLANETAELLPSFTAGLLQGKSNSTAEAASSSTDPNGSLPELLLSNDTPQKPDHLPSLDSDPMGIFNFDNLLEDQDASLGAIIAYLESPKKKSGSNNLPDLFSHDQDLASSIVNNSNSSEEFSFQALLEENSQDLSNKFRELSNLLMQQNDTAIPFNT